MNYPVQLFIVMTMAMLTLLWKIRKAITEEPKTVPKGHKNDFEIPDPHASNQDTENLKRPSNALS